MLIGSFYSWVNFVNEINESPSYYMRTKHDITFSWLKKVGDEIKSGDILAREHMRHLLETFIPSINLFIYF